MSRRNRRTIVRVDGGRQWGMGHVVRCVTLTQALSSRGADVTFVMRDDPLGSVYVNMAGFQVINIPKHDDPVETARLIRRHHPGLLITDLYPTTNAYLRRLGSTGAQVVCLTALGQVQVPADIVINGDVRFQGHVPTVNQLAARCYVGPKYFILRPEFRNGDGPRRRITQTTSNILVTVGGTAPRRFVLRILLALERVTARLHVTVVLGAAPWRRASQGEVLRVGARPVRVISGVEQMAELMRTSDLAITAGGFTLYELAATGTPSVVFCQRAHQTQTARTFERLGSCRFLGLWDQVKEGHLARVVTDLIDSPARRRTMSMAGLAVVDGGGLRRVVDILTNEGGQRSTV